MGFLYKACLEVLVVECRPRHLKFFDLTFTGELKLIIEDKAFLQAQKKPLESGLIFKNFVYISL